jgi:hypothetical protein
LDCLGHVSCQLTGHVSPTNPRSHVIRLVSHTYKPCSLSSAFLENSSQDSHLLDYLVIPCLMSQATYIEHDVRSTLSYTERETTLFGESSSGSDYDTEEALSQPTTDDGSADPVEEATVPSRQVPRRDRDQSHVTVRYGASQVAGPDGNHTQTQLCLHRGCPYPARVW